MLLALSPELLALGFRPPQTQEELLWLGVHCVLSRWTAFRMAVEGGFSSRDPARAAAEYVAGIREFLMTASGRIEPSDLSALLDQMLKDLFSTWLEEAAEFDAVSAEIVQIYHETAAGNSGKVCELLAKTTKENIFSEEMARRLALVRRDSDSSGGESVMSWVEL
eukprot:TRINITY_DN849_c3_g1_i1.p1 TRINITY_DN849_c3_g1~~TRINITY_DN849_c3_g1_i1.p1  ORF type:complete len:165 (-),score=19.64 TRINITY_DN849_c3_g1_i1:584-1078(-)